MPPIPVFTDAPLNPAAQKPEGVTPSTAAPDANQPRPTPTTTTAAAADGPPPPQPGAVPKPPLAAPTGSTATYTPADPPPPAPGAVPRAPSQAAATATTAAAGPTAAAPPTVTSVPPQLSIPAPSQTVGSTKSTSTTAPPPLSARQQPAGPTTVPLGAAPTPQSSHASDLSHPPDYVQNPYAADGSAAQRAALLAAAEKEKADEGVWGQVSEWAKAAGQRMSAVEEDLWKGFKGK